LAQTFSVTNYTHLSLSLSMRINSEIFYEENTSYM